MQDKKFYLETYGCQMNEADAELVSGILQQAGYQLTDSPAEAHLILVNSCSVRENADKRALARLSQFKSLKLRKPDLLLGLMGCVAQRDKGKVLAERPYIDLVIGPDSYRNLVDLISQNNVPAVDVRLSRTETYSELVPSRQTKVNAWVSIMRGCDKFCSFCIVPLVRGRERSRPPASIINEVRRAVDQGYKEVTLLGQNVNAYHHTEWRFPDLLQAVATTTGIQRVRFTSPHPSDFDLKTLTVIRDNRQICRHIHLPLQAGSSAVLKSMNRNYSQPDYLDTVTRIREYIPSVAITTDIIVGFPGETDADFEETLKVMEIVQFDAAFMFKYSVRPGTKAARFPDDVLEAVKAQRLKTIITLQKQHTLLRNTALIGTNQTILIEGVSRKNPEEPIGRTDSNKLVVVKNAKCNVGETVPVQIIKATGVTLFGKIT